MLPTIHQVQEALRKLDQDYYDNLLIKEKALNDALDRLQTDETHLRQAIAETSGSAAPMSVTTVVAQQRKMMQAQAEARLQEALLASSSDEESQQTNVRR
jgi:hypothetical protein